MYSGKVIEDVVAVSEQLDHPIQRLYPALLRELKGGSRQLNMLWDGMAPEGNIYRVKALEQESYKHSEDLWHQMRAIADKHANILPGATQEERADSLFKALNEKTIKTPLKVRDSELGMAAHEGYLPLQEFLGIKVQRRGHLLYPTNEGFHAFLGSNGMAVTCWFLQVIAPVALVLNRWWSPANPLKDGFVSLWNKMTLKEAVCLGESPFERLQTLSACPLLFIVLRMIMMYAMQELETTRRWAMLPRSGRWQFLDLTANVIVCVGLATAIPLLFFSEDSMTGILLDCLSMTFLLTMDDVTSNICAALNYSAEHFSRSIAWNAVLLSQCPVRLDDIIAPLAARVSDPKDLWKISFNSQGSLLTHDGRVCETRLRFERMGQQRFSYSTSPSTPRVDLKVGVATATWTVVSWILFAEMLFWPPLWLYLANECT